MDGCLCDAVCGPDACCKTCYIIPNHGSSAETCIPPYHSPQPHLGNHARQALQIAPAAQNAVEKHRSRGRHGARRVGGPTSLRQCMAAYWCVRGVLHCTCCKCGRDCGREPYQGALNHLICLQHSAIWHERGGGERSVQWSEQDSARAPAFSPGARSWAQGPGQRMTDCARWFGPCQPVWLQRLRVGAAARAPACVHKRAPPPRPSSHLLSHCASAWVCSSSGL
jgi:hypothetical protein